MRVAAEVKGFDPEGLASPKELRRLDDCVLFALAASKEAVADAGLDSAYDPARVGIVYGSAIGGIKTINQQVDILRDRGPDRVSPHWLPNRWSTPRVGRSRSPSVTAAPITPRSPPVPPVRTGLVRAPS